MKCMEPDERKIKFVEANMKFEGIPISDNVKVVCRKILKKEVSGEEYVRSCVLKYKKGTCDE